MKRAILIVMDSVGIGEMPDAEKFGDKGSSTLINIKKHVPSMELKNLCRLGLSKIDAPNAYLLGSQENILGCYGKMTEASNGKDTTTGHWEIAGIITENPFPTFTKTGFPKEVMDEFEKETGVGYLGNIAASGTEIINVLGDEHVKTGKPIVYTSADSVFQIAAHEDVIPVEKLYDICRTARKILTGKYAVARVIARPFVGTSGNYTRTANRHDFSLAPTGETMLDDIKKKYLHVAAVGKINDIFLGCGVTEKVHTTGNSDGIDKTLGYMDTIENGLIFTNLVDFDMLYGHRDDPEGYAKALEYFDSRLPEIMNKMTDEDILFITADHGCDPTTPSTDHSREYVPILVYGKNIKKDISLGTRKTYADLGKTVCDYLDAENNIAGTSFLKEIL